MSKRIRLTAAEKDIVYYEYMDGIPAYKKQGQVPMKMVKGKPTPIYDFFAFDHEATRISEEEYKKLLKESK